MSKLGNFIKEQREAKGMAREALAELVGVTPEDIEEFEGGQRMRRFSTMTKIANALGVEATDLPTDGEYPELGGGDDDDEDDDDEDGRD